MWTLAAAGAANFLFIGLKAFQQRNVVHDKHAAVVVTSNLMAFAEVYVVFTIASEGVTWPLILTLGMTGGLGCLLSMWIHRKLFS